MHGDAGFADHDVKHVFGDVRLDGVRSAGRRAATCCDERFVPFELLAVAGDESRKIFASNAADGSRIADVDGAESARRHAAEMLARFDEHGSLPHARSLYRCGDAPRRAAEDADVRLDDVRRRRFR